MKEIAEEMDNITYTNIAHREVLGKWENVRMAYGKEILPESTKDVNSLWYFLSLMLARTFIKSLSDIEGFDMSRITVYDWSSEDNKHGVAVVVTIDGYIYHADVPNTKLSTRSNMDALFINQAGKVALETGTCYYLENGDRDENANYWNVHPWGTSTRHGEPLYSVKNKMYKAEDFLALEKLK